MLTRSPLRWQNFELNSQQLLLLLLLLLQLQLQIQLQTRLQSELQPQYLKLYYYLSVGVSYFGFLHVLQLRRRLTHLVEMVARICSLPTVN